MDCRRRYGTAARNLRFGLFLDSSSLGVGVDLLQPQGPWMLLGGCLGSANSGLRLFLDSSSLGVGRGLREPQGHGLQATVWHRRSELEVRPVPRRFASGGGIQRPAWRRIGTSGCCRRLPVSAGERFHVRTRVERGARSQLFGNLSSCSRTNDRSLRRVLTAWLSSPYS